MLASLLTLSPWALILGVTISVMSVIEAFGTGKTVKERGFKCVTAVLAIALLFIQAASNKRSSADAETALNDALQQQKQELTQDLTNAFTTGTNQIIKLSGQEADKTRKAANAETSAVRRQVDHEETILKDAALGSGMCPDIAIPVVVGVSGRPHSLSVFNLDNRANLYDVHIHFIEWAPASNGIWSQILQEKTLSVPLIAPERATSVAPFAVLSKEKTADFQVDISTRASECNGRLDLRDEGNDNWRNEAIPMYKDGKLQFDGGDHKLGGHQLLLKP